jgi:hypothetical protein
LRDTIPWGRTAVEQTVFCRFCSQLADRRQPEIDGSRRQAGSFQNAAVLLNDGSAEWRPGFGRVPGDEILQCLLVGALGVRGADGVDGERGDGTPIWRCGRNRNGNNII